MKWILKMWLAFLAKREAESVISLAGAQYALALSAGDNKRAERLRVVIDHLESAKK